MNKTSTRMNSSAFCNVHQKTTKSIMCCVCVNNNCSIESDGSSFQVSLIRQHTVQKNVFFDLHALHSLENLIAIVQTYYTFPNRATLLSVTHFVNFASAQELSRKKCYCLLLPLLLLLLLPPAGPLLCIACGVKN